MSKVCNLSHKLFNYLFCGKRIIIATETKTKQLKFSALFQVLFIFLLSFSISYFTIRYNRYKNYRNYALILEENDNLKLEHRQLRDEFKKYEKKADKINEYLNVIMVDKAEKRDNQSLSNRDMVAILDKKTAEAYKKIDERKRNISSYIKKLGMQKITYNKIIKTAKVSSDSENNVDGKRFFEDVKNQVLNDESEQSSVGGVDETVERVKVVKDMPFLQVSGKKTSDDNYIKELNDIILVEKTIQSLPFGEPTTGKYRLTSAYGFRKDPLKKDGKVKLHRGVDIVLSNDHVITPKAGIVKFSGIKTGYGKCVDIEHQVDGVKSKIITHYAHLDKIFVEKGQRVEDSEIIGLQGSTGRSTGPHLHYEILINGQAVNPVNFMKATKF